MADTVTAEQVMDAVGALRKTVEEKGIDSPEYKSMVEKTEEVFKKQEEQNEKVIADLGDAQKKQLETEEQIKDLEVMLVKASSQPGSKGDHKEMPEYKALQAYVKHGEKALSPEHQELLDVHEKTMRMDNDTTGGYLTTTEFDNVITKKITEISPVRQVARVRTVSKKTLEMPIRNTIPTATYEGEAAAGDDTQSAYQNEQLTCYRLTTTVPFTMDLLMDSNFNLEAEINSDVAEAFAFTEGNKFVLGTGAKQPEGFLINAAVVAGASTTAGSLTISGDDLLLLTGELKVGYNPMFGFNRQTLAFLRTLKGSDGQYLWQANLAPNAPNTIAGDPYVIMQDMPAYNVAGNLSVIYADFLRGYTITDRTGMQIIRDDVSKKRQAIIETTFHKWNTGQVTLAEAFVALKTKS